MPRNSRGTQDERRRLLRSLLRRGRRAHTQAELVEALEQRGFAITQSSLSRDLQQLGARKVDGAYCMVAGDESLDDDEAYPTLSELQPFVRSARPAGPNLLVVSTRPGLAQTVALALDSMAMPELIGTIAGDDTVFVATPDRRSQRNLERRLKGLVNSILAARPGAQPWPRRTWSGPAFPST